MSVARTARTDSVENIDMPFASVGRALDSPTFVLVAIVAKMPSAWPLSLRGGGWVESEDVRSIKPMLNSR